MKLGLMVLLTWLSVAAGYGGTAGVYSADITVISADNPNSPQITSLHFLSELPASAPIFLPGVGDCVMDISFIGDEPKYPEAKVLNKVQYSISQTAPISGGEQLTIRQIFCVTLPLMPAKSVALLKTPQAEVAVKLTEEDKAK